MNESDLTTCPLCNDIMFKQELENHLDWHKLLTNMRGWL